LAFGSSGVKTLRQNRLSNRIFNSFDEIVDIPDGIAHIVETVMVAVAVFEKSLKRIENTHVFGFVLPNYGLQSSPGVATWARLERPAPLFFRCIISGRSRCITTSTATARTTGPGATAPLARVAIWLLSWDPLNGLRVAQSGSLGTVPNNWSVVGTSEEKREPVSDIDTQWWMA
jgi:hypothetical protein